MPRLELNPAAPESAVAAFERKRLLEPGFHWADIWQHEHSRAFTVAKLMQVDLLDTVRTAVDEGIKEGITPQEFRKRLRPTLEAAGWWGVREVVDPVTGRTVPAQLGSPYRLEFIFKTNNAVAYEKGHWEKIEQTAQRRPWLIYDATLDNRTRPKHEEWGRRPVVLPHDDPWWDSHYPPNGWGPCRCSVIQANDRQLERMGLTPSGQPVDRMETWQNPRTGETILVPEGVDPGWNYHVGKQGDHKLLESSREKLEDARYQPAISTIRDLVTGAAFTQFWRQPQGEFPMGKLSKRTASNLNLNQSVVVLPDVTLEEMKANNPELTLGRLKQIERSIHTGTGIKTSDSLVFYREQRGTLYRTQVEPETLRVLSHEVSTVDQLENDRRTGTVFRK